MSLQWCKQNNLSVILFSGYAFSEIKYSELDGVLELLEHTDVLIDGEYIDELYDESLGIVGSSNQQIYFFTDLYSLKDFKNEISVDFIVKNNRILINGWPIKI
ncbi:4Fe-4S cluster-binding domain-containing protein [Campylobacter devanensis]|uniref:4Fe-4S cluster-binding domain-containing protein n=1 Tax=Campylobacter devanensis TaxID=3161138 RepID=UPI000A3480C7|nr:4Fe-4S cluster-binding domain-containing protein [Campylobacter sp. P0139]